MSSLSSPPEPVAHLHTTTALHGTMMGWRPWGEQIPGTPVWGDVVTHWASADGAYWLRDKVAFIWRAQDALRVSATMATWLDRHRAGVLGTALRQELAA